jgi:hypothetical protein
MLRRRKKAKMLKLFCTTMMLLGWYFSPVCLKRKTQYSQAYSGLFQQYSLPLPMFVLKTRLKVNGL